MNRDCERVGNLISDYVDETLNAEERQLVSSHIETCEACRHQLETTRKLVGRLGGLGSNSAPFDLWQGVSARITAEEQRPRGFLQRLAGVAGKRIIAIPAAVGTAAVLILLAHPAKENTPVKRSTAVNEASAEYRAYMQAYTNFRSQQTLTDRAAIDAAAQLQNNTQGEP